MFENSVMGDLIIGDITEFWLAAIMVLVLVASASPLREPRLASPHEWVGGTVSELDTREFVFLSSPSATPAQNRLPRWGFQERWPGKSTLSALISRSQLASTAAVSMKSMLVARLASATKGMPASSLQCSLLAVLLHT